MCRQWDSPRLGEYSLQPRVLLEMNYCQSTRALLEKNAGTCPVEWGAAQCPQCVGTAIADQSVSEGSLFSLGSVIWELKESEIMEYSSCG